MTHFEYDLAFLAVIGLAGCAMALVAVIADWRETIWDYRAATHWYERQFEEVDPSPRTFTTPKVG